jgi:hypothetical protein
MLVLLVVWVYAYMREPDVQQKKASTTLIMSSMVRPTTK